MKVLIRPAEMADIDRIAEILVFAKRTAYRDIFQNDHAMFNSLRVVKTYEELKTSAAIDNILVYDDGIIKGLIHHDTINEEDVYFDSLYIDPFFQSNGIGPRLIFHLARWAVRNNFKHVYGWVLEGNERAINLYKRLNARFTGARKEFENSGKDILQFVGDLEPMRRLMNRTGYTRLKNKDI